MVAVDFENAETGNMEAGSGIKSTFPRAIFSTAWASSECEGGDCGRCCDSDSGRINSGDAADDTGEVDGKELEEGRDICSEINADVDGTTAARDISSPRGEGETGGCDTSVVGVGACDSGMDVGLERGELCVSSAMNSDNDNIKQLVEERQSRVFVHAPVSELSARGSPLTLPPT